MRDALSANQTSAEDAIDFAESSMTPPPEKHALDKYAYWFLDDQLPYEKTAGDEQSMIDGQRELSF